MAAAPGLLYIIGLGLGDHRDITRRGSDAIASCDVVFLEAYTSILCVDAPALEAALGKRIELAHRETVESESELILGPARAGQTVAFLVVGDPFGATTHTDLLLRARAAGVPTRVVHNASIMNAVGACGLQLYSFGQTVSVPFFRNAWQPDSFYDRIAFNASGGLHTLCLMGAFVVQCIVTYLPLYPLTRTRTRAHARAHADIKVREPDFELLARTGRKQFLPPRFMSIHRAIAQLLSVEARRKGGVCAPHCLAVGMARVGQETEAIVSGTLQELLGCDFGGPLHSLVLVAPGTPHDLEAEMLAHYRLTAAQAVGYAEEFEDWDGQPPAAEEEAGEGGGE